MCKFGKWIVGYTGSLNCLRSNSRSVKFSATLEALENIPKALHQLKSSYPPFIYSLSSISIAMIDFKLTWYWLKSFLYTENIFATQVNISYVILFINVLILIQFLVPDTLLKSIWCGLFGFLQIRHFGLAIHRVKLDSAQPIFFLLKGRVTSGIATFEIYSYLYITALYTYVKAGLE